MNATEFEKKVWDVEGVRIVLRVDPNAEVGEYEYKNAADESWRITELGSKRIEKSIGNIPYVVLQGNGEEPHGKVVLRTIRGGYRSE